MVYFKLWKLEEKVVVTIEIERVIKSLKIIE